MKPKLSKLFAAAVLVIVMITELSTAVFADVPYNSYTYWSDVGEEDKAVGNRQMYSAKALITAKSLGVKDFTEISDIGTDKDGRLYILDGSSRITVTDKNFSLLYEIGKINGTYEYNEAGGLYIERDGTVYICDTKNHRLLHITTDGKLIREIGLPDSPLIPDDFNFLPTAMTTDKDGFLYVLSDGSFYGALLYSPELEFMGFYGANSVKGSLASVLTNIKNKIISNKGKKANSKQNLPYCFVDIAIDDGGFIYTCNGYTDKSGKTGQIRRLSPGTGLNLLSSDDINFADSKQNGEYNNGILTKQDIMDVEVDSHGFIFGLESAYGKVFVYDKNGKTMSVLGGGTGSGTQTGTFVNVSSMALGNDGEKIYVSDKRTNYITTFSVTEFGRLVRAATELTVEGKYDKSKEMWQEALKQDNNYQPAYSALARISLNEKKYAEAMSLAKTGYDRDTYALAFEYERNRFLNDNFLWIFVLVIVAAVTVITLLIIKSKKHITLIKNREIKIMMSVPVHPVNTFTDIKEKQLGSYALCTVTILIFYISTVLQTLAGGFMFSVYDSANFNSLWVFVRSVGLVTLWVAADWMVCTLLGGNGKLKEITVVTCYSLWPLIASNFLKLLLTNILLPTESGFLSILDTAAIIYFLILMVIGLLKIHDFSMSRLVGTSVLALVGIAAIVFLIIMVAILVQQFWGFIVTVVSEISTL